MHGETDFHIIIPTIPLFFSFSFFFGCYFLGVLKKHVYVDNSFIFFFFAVIVSFLRESLIDKQIENAVSQMQSIIELGRVIRDRKTLPVKVNDQLLSTYTL